MKEVWLFFLSVCSFIGPFSLIDSLITDRARNTVANYVFGLHGATAKNFENAVVDSWIGLFFWRGRIRTLRVVVVSAIILVAPLFSISAYFNLHGTQMDPEKILGGLMFFLLLLGFSLVTLPFDIVNLKIGRRIYYGRYRSRSFSFKLFLDFTMSTFAGLAMLLLILAFLFSVLYFFDRDTLQDPRNSEGASILLAGLVVAGIFGFVFSIIQYVLVRSAVVGVGVIV